MKKLLILLITLSLSAVPVIAQETKTEPAADETTKPKEKYDFRKIRWGMTVEEVINSEEGLEYTEKDDYKEFLGKYIDIYGETVLLHYSFTFGKLYSARYLFLKEHQNDNDYIQDYNRIQKLIEEEYGEPSISPQYKWDDENNGNDSSNLGYALRLGHLSIFSGWHFFKDKELNIRHDLDGYKTRIDHIILFYKDDMPIISAMYRDLIQKKQKK